MIAADYARSLGITVAVATIGPPSAFRPGEVPGMAGNDTSLIFAVSDWNALKNRDSTLVRNLTSMVSLLKTAADHHGGAWPGGSS